MFWRRMTPWAGLAGLIAGTSGAAITYILFITGTVEFGSELSQTFWGAIVAFLADAVVTVIVSLMTKPKPVEELQGLVWGMANVDEGATASDRVWYRSPGLLAGGILALTATASLLFI